MQILSYGSEGQNFEISFKGLKSKCGLGKNPSRSFWMESFLLPFSASKSCLHPLAGGPTSLHPLLQSSYLLP